MKNSFERQVESLIQQRFRERDRCFDGRLVEVMQEYNGRGILRSSIAVGAMHAELEREFEESAAGCVKAAVDAMTSRPTALPLPRVFGYPDKAKGRVGGDLPRMYKEHLSLFEQ